MNYDESQQLLLGLVLAVMIFGVSLELRVQQFMAIARQPQPILAGVRFQSRPVQITPSGAMLTCWAMSSKPRLRVWKRPMRSMLSRPR